MSGRFFSVKGVTDNLRMPRLGKIRLGLKILNDSKTHLYPRETKHFVCPPEVEAVYGPTPTELDIVFPLDNQADAFPQAYKWYAGPSLRCKGDGQSALRVAGALGNQVGTVKERIPADPTAMVEICCPCPLLDKDEKGKSQCTLVGTLSFMLPKVSIAGIYQIDMRSYNSILNLNSSLVLARQMVGRISMIPFKLKRLPQEIQYKGKTTTHYILNLEHQLNLAQIETIRGKNFMMGYEPGLEAQEAPLMDPEQVEELPPGDPAAKTIEVFLLDVLTPDENFDYYIIKGQEDPGEDTPILEFRTTELSHAKAVWELVKNAYSGLVTYKVLEDGSFEILKIVKGKTIETLPAL